MKIRYLAVLVAAIVHWLLGGLWYGVIIKNKFMELIAWSPEKLQQMANQSEVKSLGIAFFM